MEKTEVAFKRDVTIHSKRNHSQWTQIERQSNWECEWKRNREREKSGEIDANARQSKCSKITICLAAGVHLSTLLRYSKFHIIGYCLYIYPADCSLAHCILAMAVATTYYLIQTIDFILWNLYILGYNGNQNYRYKSHCDTPNNRYHYKSFESSDFQVLVNL